MIKNFLIFIIVGAVIWVLRFALIALMSMTSQKLEGKPKLSTGTLANIVRYFSIFFIYMSYAVFAPLVIFLANWGKLFAWVFAASLIVPLVIASTTTMQSLREHRANYSLSAGVCWLTMFIVNIFNVNLICPLIKSVFQTSYGKNISTLPFDTLTIVVFIFDVVLLVLSLKKIKKDKSL